MSKDRKTSNDYRKEYRELKNSEKSLDSHLTNRIFELCKKYPEVCSEKMTSYHSILDGTEHHAEISKMGIIVKLDFLRSIEDYMNARERVIQTKINFTT
jgi:hypothetical protein